MRPPRAAFLILLLALPARADDPAALERGLRADFAAGLDVRLPAGAPKDVVDLARTLSLFQCGADGTDEGKALLRDLILHFKTEPVVPANIVDEYVSRRRAERCPGDPGSNQRTAAAARVAPDAAASAAQRAQAAVAGWTKADESLPTAAGPNALPRAPGASMLPQEVQRQLGFSSFASPPPEAYVAKISPDSRPVWTGDPIQYLHDWMWLHQAVDQDRLDEMKARRDKNLPADREAACLDDLTSGDTIGDDLVYASGLTVTGVRQVALDFTAPDAATRRQAAVGLAPFVNSAPAAVRAVAQMDREGYSRAAVCRAVGAAAGVGLDLAGLTAAGKLALKGTGEAVAQLDRAAFREANRDLIERNLTLGPAERRAAIGEQLGLSPKDPKIDAVMKAHEEFPCAGKDCTFADIRGKYEILTEAGFTRPQIEQILDSGLAGFKWRELFASADAVPSLEETRKMQGQVIAFLGQSMESRDSIRFFAGTLAKRAGKDPNRFIELLTKELHGSLVPETGLPRVAKNLSTEELYELIEKGPFIDNGAGSNHGTVSHLFQMAYLSNKMGPKTFASFLKGVASEYDLVVKKNIKGGMTPEAAAADARKRAETMMWETTFDARDGSFRSPEQITQMLCSFMPALPECRIATRRLPI